MLKRLMIFLTISLSLSCAHEVPATDFDADWEYLAVPGYPVKACLVQEDVVKLKRILNQCKGSSDGK